MTTMKMPENRAVIETAMFMTLVAMLRSTEFVIASVIGRPSGHHVTPPRLHVPRQIHAGARY